MSGFQNVTGFQAPTSLGAFMGLLQNAFWRGVPFKVTGAVVRKGRKIAPHDYPFRDGGWMEDMGRASRVYSFTGYLIGDLAPVMQLALDTVSELPGPGLLIHPTLGAQRVALLSCATSVRKDAMRVIEVQFEFIEQGARFFPGVLIATAFSVLAASDIAVTASAGSLGGVAGPAAATGSRAVGSGVAVVTGFSAASLGHAANAASLVSMAVGLPAVDNSSSFGRYANGRSGVTLPIGTTVSSLEDGLAAQREQVQTLGSAAAATADLFTTATAPAVTAALDAVTEATRLTMTDPGDQVNALLDLATYQFPDASTAGSYLGASIDTVRDAMGSTCRRAALISLARASAAYQPASYQDASNRIDLLGAAFDVEITAAADNGEDDAYASLRSLRAAVILDLKTRGSSLPMVATVTLPGNLPSLVIGQMLYRDASRADEITQEANPRHPAFCPVSFQALAT